MKILVLGAGGNAANNFVRCVRDEHVTVGVDTDKHMLELSEAHAIMDVSTRPADGDAHLHTINNLCRHLEIDFIHAQPDQEVEFLAANRERLGAKVLLPPVEVIRACRDKLNCAQILGPELAPRSWSFSGPIPASGWLRARTGAGSLAAFKYTNERHALDWANLWFYKGLRLMDFMASDYLPGEDLSWTSVWEEGHIVAAAARKRVEYLGGERTITGQTSTPKVAELIDPTYKNLEARCARAVLNLDPQATGIYYIDTKCDAHDVPMITEVNAGRFNTTVNAWAEAGCNLPLCYLKTAMGESYQPPEYEYGSKWIRNMEMGPRLVTARERISV